MCNLCNFCTHMKRHFCEILVICGSQKRHSSGLVSCLRYEYMLPLHQTIWRRTVERSQRNCNAMLVSANVSAPPRNAWRWQMWIYASSPYMNTSKRTAIEIAMQCLCAQLWAHHPEKHSSGLVSCLATHAQGLGFPGKGGNVKGDPVLQDLGFTFTRRTLYRRKCHAKNLNPGESGLVKVKIYIKFLSWSLHRAH